MIEWWPAGKSRTRLAGHEYQAFRGIPMSKVHPTDRMRDCQACGKLFRARLIKGNRETCCSAECKARSEAKSKTAESKFELVTVQAESVPEVVKAKRKRTGGRPLISEIECPRCGTTFKPRMTPDGRQQYCSKQCFWDTKGSKTSEKDYENASMFDDPQDGALVPLTQGHWAIVDKEDHDRVSQHRWRLYRTKFGSMFAVRCAGGSDTQSMHAFISSKPASRFVTRHKNKNGLDNRKRNLRSRRKYDCPKEEQRNAYLSSKYGVSKEWYDEKFIEQNGQCAICKKQGLKVEGRRTKGTLGRLVVDHDHGTNEVRELICGHCNTGLGSFKDDDEALQRAAEYVRFHRKQQDAGLSYQPEADLSECPSEHRS